MSIFQPTETPPNFKRKQKKRKKNGKKHDDGDFSFFLFWRLLFPFDAAGGNRGNKGINRELFSMTNSRHVCLLFDGRRVNGPKGV